jgi:GH18 family chitinase
MYKDRDWISYDTIENIQKRAAYVVANNLGGLFVWSRMYFFLNKKLIELFYSS